MTSSEAAVPAEVLCEVRNHVACITLNRPSALNALSLAMIVTLRKLLDRCASDSDIRAIMLRGAGDKAFCAGGDIRALYENSKSGGTLQRDFFAAEYSLDYLLHRYPKPYIALIDGITMGGGMGLAQGSSLRIVGDRTRIAMPEVAIGLFPDVGASYFLSRLTGSLGPYLALTGHQIRGADALYARLADVYLDQRAVDGLNDRIETLTWTGDSAADLRRMIHESAAQGLGAPSLSLLHAAIDDHFKLESVPDILASLEAETRSDYADWARQTVKLMRSRSPTMLGVTLEQLRRGKTMELAACFRMELVMIQQCYVQGDFLEGVRALIIDKDNSPHWNPSDLAEVSADSVKAFFTERWRGKAHPLWDLESAARQVSR